MDTEVALGLIGLGGSIAAGGGYVIRKWMDTRMEMVKRQADMQAERLRHELEMETRRVDRETASAERDRETAAYIATNTEVLKDLSETIKAQLGNGVSKTVRENTEMVAHLSQTIVDEMGGVKKTLEKIIAGPGQSK